MVHLLLQKYAKHCSKRQWPPRALTKKDAEAVIDSIVEDAKEILVRQLRNFYASAWEAYRSIPCAKENPATDDRIQALCSTIFEEVKQRVSCRFDYLLGWLKCWTMTVMESSISADPQPLPIGTGLYTIGLRPGGMVRRLSSEESTEGFEHLGLSHARNENGKRLFSWP